MVQRVRTSEAVEAKENEEAVEAGEKVEAGETINAESNSAEVEEEVKEEVKPKEEVEAPPARIQPELAPPPPPPTGRPEFEPMTTSDGKMVRVRYLTQALKNLYQGDGGMGWMEPDKAERSVKAGICEIVLRRKVYANKMMTSETPQRATGLTWGDLYGQRDPDKKKLKAFEDRDVKPDPAKEKELKAFKDRVEGDNFKPAKREKQQLGAFAGRDVE